MATINRITCPDCGAQCIENETYCWQCGQLLNAPPSRPAESASVNSVEKPERANGKMGVYRLSNLLNKKEAPPPAPVDVEKLIQFEPGASASQNDQPVKRMAMTMTGEMVEVEDPAPSTVIHSEQPAAPEAASESDPAAEIGGTSILEGERPHLIRLTWCKHCGYDNPEGVVECIKCKNMLEVVEEGSVKEIEMPPRAWAFDGLGAVWIILGFAAVYAGQFLLKADASRKHASWADYFWTGVVVCAPGIFIFMRHHFCKLMFWVMTLASALVWAVIGFIWLYVGMQVTDEGQVGLIWLAVLSGLSLISYFIVRQNDAFDFGS